ncbi:MAG: hypothetical protein U1F70_09810 [Candidatus Competibacteraceae bacterium]
MSGKTMVVDGYRIFSMTTYAALRYSPRCSPPCSARATGQNWPACGTTAKWHGQDDR